MRVIRRNIYKITIIVVLLVIIGFVIIKRNLKNNEVLARTNENIVEKEDIIKEEKKEEVDKNPMYADIKGEIINPGVYEINNNDRVIDIINKAGGMTEFANTSLINLAMKVTDEMVIVIYSNSEIDNKMNNKDIIVYECECPDIINDVCVSETNNTINTNGDNKNIINDNNPINNNSDILSTNNIININIASKDDLMSLTGIGESKALAIIDYRNTNGNFITKEDIMNVSGIGESIYEKIKDSIST